MPDNALNRLLKDRVEGTAETYSSIAVRANMPRSTVHNLATKPLTAMPKRETLEKLAIGLSLPLAVIIRAAQEACGFYPYEETLQNGDSVILLSKIESLSPEKRAAVVGMVDHLLKTMDL